MTAVHANGYRIRLIGAEHMKKLPQNGSFFIGIFRVWQRGKFIVKFGNYAHL